MVAKNQDKPKYQQPHDLCHLAGDAIIDERNRYYTGRYMTARDFQGDQDFFLSRHRMHNRLLHDWGIVCGLSVSPHPNPSCRNRYVVISPGIAIDCYGRELVLKEKTVVEIWEPEPVSSEALEQVEGAVQEDQSVTESEAGTDDEELQGQIGHRRKRRRIKGGPFLVILRYHEKGVEWTPALYAEDGCDPRQLEANRVREVVCLEVHRWDKDRHAGCWPIPEEDRPEERIPCRDDCNDEGDPGSPGCLEADCPCEYGVPLALVTPWYRRRRQQWDIGEENIEWEGRREIRTSPQALTHIVDYNWKHGGLINLSHLRSPNGMDGKLKIYFDRRLYEPPHGRRRGIGINEHTFVVTMHRQDDVDYEPQILYNDGNPPEIENEEGSCAAVLHIDDELLTGEKNVGECLLQVTLKCDFILDCHHRPVDGDHLAGKTPTGNGTAGGTFESWFYVRDDERDYRQREKNLRRERERQSRGRQQSQEVGNDE